MTIKTDINFAPGLSTRVNFHLMPDLHYIVFSVMSKRVEQKLDEIVEPPETEPVVNEGENERLR